VNEEPAERASEQGPAARRWWLIPWYPVAFPIAYIVMMWSGTGIEPIWMIRPMALAVAVTLLTTFGFSWLLRDRDRGGLAATIFIVALALDDARVAALVAVVGLVVVAEGLVNRGIAWKLGRTATRAMTTLGAALIVVVAVSTLQQGTFGWAVDDVASRLSRPAQADHFDPSSPDIVVLLLDGYPGDAAATLDPTFDADAFPAALAARGFDVERNSRSNYLLTRLTLATMFGDVHVAETPALAEEHGPGPSDNRRLRLLTDRGPVLKALAGAGYETITITSAALDLGLYDTDRVISQPGAQEFETGLLKITTLGHLVDAVVPQFIGDQSRANVLGVFDSSIAVSRELHTRPRFVFAHVMAPHAPLLFAADGSPSNASVLSESFVEPDNAVRSLSRVTATFEYATFVADRAKQAVDQILANATRETVLVVMSDHGTDTLFNAKDPLASDLNERSSNFLAVRTPDHPKLLPPGTTPINVLPRILNAYVGSNLPYQSDTTWAWKAGQSILEAVQVDLGTMEPLDQ
jgi:hypothetical protein